MRLEDSVIHDKVRRGVKIMFQHRDEVIKHPNSLQAPLPLKPSQPLHRLEIGSQAFQKLQTIQGMRNRRG